jgi:hypothetical protein
MKAQELKDIMNNLPVYEAVFTITKVPNWAADLNIAVGDEYIAGGNKPYSHPKTKHRILIEASYLNFIGYRLCS